MAAPQAYSPEAIIQSNLAEGTVRHQRICEQELAHLSELATEIAEGESLSAEFLASLPEHRLPLIESADTVKERIDRVWKSVCLSTAILNRLEMTTPSAEWFFPEADEPSENAADRILYRKNGYTDRAYLKFAGLLVAPRAAYADTFEAVCEGVYEGDCEYCILPLENSEEGRLNSFWRLIGRFGLKIVATCDVPTASHGQTTRFALLRLAPQRLADKHRSGYLLECAIPQSSLPASDALYAADCCGLDVARVDVGFLPTERNTPTTHLVLRTESERIAAFLLYLSMEAPDYTFIGYYPHIPNDRKDS